MILDLWIQLSFRVHKLEGLDINIVMSSSHQGPATQKRMT